jgi:ribose 5-phosphate isomerase B
MRIAVGSDHAGFALKTAVVEHLAAAGHEVVDLGTDRGDVSVDYPVYGLAVGRAVAEGRVERGVCVCGSGVGIGIAANKVPGIRAALVHDADGAELARRHNDANVLCLGGRTTGVADARAVLDVFCTTPFDGGRHQHRLEEIAAYEAGRPVDGGPASDDQERQPAAP